MNTDNDFFNDLPEDFSADLPNAARMYDYMLGGYHNFEVDRKTIELTAKLNPDIFRASMVNRNFLRRAVTFLVNQGIDQFLDVGSGVPTVGNVHEVAQNINPEARVVYVDIDPIAVAHSRTILKGNPNASVIQADAKNPDQILNHPEVLRLLDFSRPIGALFISVLHFVPDNDQAYNAIYTIRDAISSGSYIVIAHASYDNSPEEMAQRMREQKKRSQVIFVDRTMAEFKKFFIGLEIIDPGLVFLPLWRPESPEDTFLDQPERSLNYAGVGRKP